VVRLQAVRALEKIGDVRAVKPLIRALGDWCGEVRWMAAGALGKIGDAWALPELERVA
jgi:HEAT repeat protein